MWIFKNYICKIFASGKYKVVNTYYIVRNGFTCKTTASIDRQTANACYIVADISTYKRVAAIKEWDIIWIICWIILHRSRAFDIGIVIDICTWNNISPYAIIFCCRHIANLYGNINNVLSTAFACVRLFEIVCSINICINITIATATTCMGCITLPCTRGLCFHC